MATTAMTTVKGWGPLPRLVREMAGDRALKRILQRHDVPEAVLGAPQARIPLAKMIRVFEAAANVTGASNLGQLVGDAMSVGDYGDWAAYSVGGRTLRDGLRRVCGTIWVHEIGSRMFLSEREDHVVWSYATGFEGTLGTRLFSDHILKPMLDFLRTYLGAGWEPDWLEVGYAAPQSRSDEAVMLRAPIHYERPAFGIPIRSSALDALIQFPEELPRPLTSVDLLKHARKRNGDTLGLLREAIDLCLLDGSTKLDAVARLLDLGPRTLQRRLALHGVTFRELLREKRQCRATALLLETNRPVKLIAADLGYGEAENFTRAFRAWQGDTPSEFRSKSGNSSPNRTHGPGSIVAK